MLAPNDIPGRKGLLLGRQLVVRTGRTQAHSSTPSRSQSEVRRTLLYHIAEHVDDEASDFAATTVAATTREPMR